jgi:hypothetical protein
MSCMRNMISMDIIPHLLVWLLAKWHIGIVMTQNEVPNIIGNFIPQENWYCEGVYLLPEWSYVIFLMKIISPIRMQVIFYVYQSELSNYPITLTLLNESVVWFTKMVGNTYMYNDSYNNIFDKLGSYLIPFTMSTVICFVILHPLYIDFSWSFLWPLRFLVFWVLIWISGIGISPVGCFTWVFIRR